MNEQTSPIGPLMKAARKFKKFNQSDVAKAIGCSQSALSKMEHSLLVPSAPQWFLFSRFTSIPPEAIETGIIDRHSRVLLNNDNASMGYKLPKRYRLNRAQKVRSIYPYLLYLEKKIDGEMFEHFTQSVSIESEFFLDFDNLISFQLVVDLINLYLRFGINRPEDIKEIVLYGQNDIFWDKYDEGLKHFDTTTKLLEEFALQQPYFQGDFKVTVDQKGEYPLISFIPEPHLYHFLKDVTTETTDWFALYRKFTIENLIQRYQGKKVEAVLQPELSISPLENRYVVR